MEAELGDEIHALQKAERREFERRIKQNEERNAAVVEKRERAEQDMVRQLEKDTDILIEEYRHTCAQRTHTARDRVNALIVSGEGILYVVYYRSCRHRVSRG